MENPSLSFGWELFVAQTTSQLCQSLGFGEQRSLGKDAIDAMPGQALHAANWPTTSLWGDRSLGETQKQTTGPEKHSAFGMRGPSRPRRRCRWLQRIVTSTASCDDSLKRHVFRSVSWCQKIVLGPWRRGAGAGDSATLGMALGASALISCARSGTNRKER